MYAISQAESVLDRLFTEWKAADASLDFDREYDGHGVYLITVRFKDDRRIGFARTRATALLLANAADETLAYLTKQVFKSIDHLRKSPA